MALKSSRGASTAGFTLGCEEQERVAPRELRHTLRASVVAAGGIPNRVASPGRHVVSFPPSAGHEAGWHRGSAVTAPREPGVARGEPASRPYSARTPRAADHDGCGPSRWSKRPSRTRADIEPGIEHPCSMTSPRAEVVIRASRLRGPFGTARDQSQPSRSHASHRALRDAHRPVATAFSKLLISSYDAAKESNLPSGGLPRPAGFEDRMGHQAPAAPRGILRAVRNRAGRS